MIPSQPTSSGNFFIGKNSVVPMEFYVESCVNFFFHLFSNSGSCVSLNFMKNRQFWVAIVFFPRITVAPSISKKFTYVYINYHEFLQNIRNQASRIFGIKFCAEFWRCKGSEGKFFIQRSFGVLRILC